MSAQKKRPSLFGDVEAEEKEKRETEKNTATVRYDATPVPLDELLNQGSFVSLYGETTTGKSSLFESLGYFNKELMNKEIVINDKVKWEPWAKLYPKTAKMFLDGYFPDLSAPGSIAILDLDKKYGAYLSKGDWVRKGYKMLAKSGIYTFYQVRLPERTFSIQKEGGVKIEGKEDLEFAKNYFKAIIDTINADTRAKVFVIDPISDYLDFCTERFLAMFDKVMPTLMKSPVDTTDGMRQTNYSIRNQEFLDMIERLRESGRWVFLSFNMSRTPPQYQKEPDKTDIFNTAAFKVTWSNKTPESIDQIAYCYRVPKSNGADEYHIQHKKGPWKTTKTDIIIPDTPYIAQAYFETIADSIMGGD
jgi:hypothetical protein